MPAPTILIVHPDPDVRKVLTGILGTRERRVLATDDPATALALPSRDTPDVVLCPAWSGRSAGGLELVKAVRERARGADILLLLDAPLTRADTRFLVESRRLEVVDMIGPPVDAPRLQRAVDEALQLRQLRRTASPVEAESPGRRLVGEAPAMARVRRLIAAAATHDRVVVLLLGESGTGKELVAREIHRRSGRADEPFVAVRFGSLQPTLAPSELFGHVKGAFTGADRDHAGSFARAARGTVFLDEIGDLPLELQPRLLAVLQEREFRPVGSDTVQSTDARVIAATHRDLARGVEEGWFREDLFYRLHILVVR